MRLFWAILAGLLLGAGLYWWQAREAERSERRQARVAVCVHEPHRCDPPGTLYRWRDAAGVLQVTDTPPKGRHYQRIDRSARPGIEVRGDRGDRGDSASSHD
ncbi:MAG TPA: DUF4124 domain-containing protein [Xanthomonadaceae bacterium]|nr:DUF4124 domain-containing protein [Xanthomonadaceae bacterium]